MAVLIKNKIDFRIRNVTRDQERYFKMIKESIYQGYITTVNVTSNRDPSNRDPKHMKQKSYKACPLTIRELN